MTGPRNAAAVASLVLLCSAAGCTNFYEVPIETPIQPKMDVTPFTRILVAGFISGGSDDVDGNLETVRLLRSQLRSKSSLRVIEAEVLPLVEIAREQSKDAAAATAATETSGGGPGPSQPPVEPAPPSSTSQPPVGEGPPQQPPVGEGAPQQPPAPAPPSTPVGPVVESTDGKIRNEKDLERYQSIFENTAFWKKLGEQHQNPLIVTGTVLFTNTQSAGFVNQNREIIDPLGRRVVQPYRVYMERKGFIIEPRFVFIDGRTGAVLFSDRFHEEVLYPASQQTPALSTYFELMDRLIPSFLGSLSTQRIRGTRVLLK
jgi:hypothetical protein